MFEAFIILMCIPCLIACIYVVVRDWNKHQVIKQRQENRRCAKARPTSKEYDDWTSTCVLLLVIGLTIMFCMLGGMYE